MPSLHTPIARCRAFDASDHVPSSRQIGLFLFLHHRGQRALICAIEARMRSIRKADTSAVVPITRDGRGGGPMAITSPKAREPTCPAPPTSFVLGKLMQISQRGGVGSALIEPFEHKGRCTGPAIRSRSDQVVPLNKLVELPRYVHRLGDPAADAERKARIAARGLLPDLIVKPTANGKFEVGAGRRRCRAMLALADEKILARDDRHARRSRPAKAPLRYPLGRQVHCLPVAIKQVATCPRKSIAREWHLGNLPGLAQL